MKELTRDSLLDEMLAAFPEWQPSYDDLLDYGGGRTGKWPGLHNPFMIAFLPDLLLPLLSATDGGEPVVPTVVLDLPPRGSAEAEAILGRVFAFLDRMAVSPDPEIRAVLTTTVGPALLDAADMRTAAEPRLGAATRELLRQVGGLPRRAG